MPPAFQCVCAQPSTTIMYAMGMFESDAKRLYLVAAAPRPIAYMTLVDGWAHTHWNAGGMLYTEAAVALAGLLLFLGVGASARRLAPTA